jgi:hypothetical protein
MPRVFGRNEARKRYQAKREIVEELAIAWSEASATMDPGQRDLLEQLLEAAHELRRARKRLADR